MKLRAQLIFAFMIFGLINLGGAYVPRPALTGAISKTGVGAKRIQFRITTVEEHQEARTIISDATIEGPPGTDFEIDLKGARFKMSARFRTDLLSPQSLKMRARLDTRRLYGYSERQLPLYEEDQQDQTIELGFDEQIVLLPFGRRDAGDKIKIEITPTTSDNSVHLADGRRRPLEIDILKQSPNGEISIQASKSPHNFAVEASLLEDGVEVARGETTAFIEEAGELALRPTDGASRETLGNPLIINLTIDQYRRDRPADAVGITFDAYRLEGNRDSAGRFPVAQRWAGMGSLGSELTYDVSDTYLKGTGKRYELRFKIKLASNEVTD